MQIAEQIGKGSWKITAVNTVFTALSKFLSQTESCCFVEKKRYNVKNRSWA